MKTNRLILRAAVLAALFGASSVAMAADYVVTPIVGTAQALAPNGIVVGYTTNGDGSQSLYMTGANGAAPLTNLGGTSPSGSWYPYNGSGQFSFGSYYGSLPAGTASSITPSPSSYLFSPGLATFVAVNSAGAVAANANSYSGAFGVILNANGTETALGGTVSGLNASGAAVFNGGSGGQIFGNSYTAPVPSAFLPVVESVLGNVGTFQGTFYTVTASPSYYLPAGSTTPVAVPDLGYGSTALGVNNTGQVTGTLFTNSQLEAADIENDQGGGVAGYWNYPHINFNSGTNKAFRTGANASGLTVFGVANGVASTGTAINATGQVGGYITLSNGTEEAFLSTAHGGLLVGLGVGNPGDSAQVEFLNDLGQAIILDNTTDAYYLYSGGSDIAITSLGAAAYDPVVGFNDAGQILLADPEILTPTTPGTDISGLSGAYSNTGTYAYAALAASQGFAPTGGSTFFTDPAASDDSSFSTYSGPSTGGGDPSLSGGGGGGGGGSSVPTPASWALFGLGGLFAAAFRRRKSASAA
jgi:hypothetical protein